jgi:hypothetical protein
VIGERAAQVAIGEEAGERAAGSDYAGAAQGTPGHRDDHVLEVDPVIAVRVRPIVQQCVIQKIEKGSERTVESRCRTVVPVFLGENQVDVVSRGGADASVLEDCRSVVEDQASLETIWSRR